MKKIYEAFGKKKRIIVEENNDYRAFQKITFYKKEIGINDFLMVTSIEKEQLDKNLDVKWCLNGLLPEKFDKEDITIIEPLSEHYDKSLKKINEVDTRFDGKIELSKQAIILISVKLYEELKKDHKYKKILKQFNVRLYEGEKDLALRMLFLDKNFSYMDINEKGYILDEKNHADIIEYNNYIIKLQDEIMDKIKSGNIEEIKREENKRYVKRNEENENCKIITGLTENDEGNIILDENTNATTDIGKMREKQEDAILLIKDEKNPEFKMMVVADGMGGCKYGEFASHIIIEEMKKWFENLSEEQRKCYYTGIEGLKEDLFDEIEIKIQPKVQYDTLYYGGSTLVCAIVGKKDTLVANVGDSRAYIVKKGKLIQISREDNRAQENLEAGRTPNKEVARFDLEANQISQFIGMNRNQLNRPYVKILDNNDYDMLLLFTDGVTDCLSDEDIAVACRTTDKKELANKIVEKAIRHDSILPDGVLDEYNNLTPYIPGGKDNATAAIYVSKKGEER